MGEQLQKVLKSFRQFWDAQERKRKIIYISILAAVVLIAIIFAIILNKKEYVVLYTGLEASEAATIASEIQTLGYEVNLKSGGTISVVNGTENQIAMEMSMLGYPKGSGKLDFSQYTENVGMMTTESEKKVYYYLALESKLAAVVAQFNGIESSVVNLAVPEQKNTVIATLRQEPSASVTVHIERNGYLSNDQINGITALIAAAVPGMKEENVVIVDGNGIQQIAGVSSIDEIANLTRKFAFKTQMENSIRDKIYAMLIKSYGEENVSVAVNMLLNFDSKVSELVDYQAEPNTNTGVLQHGDVVEANGSTTADGGVVGVERNADDTYPTGDTNGNGAWSESEISNTYLVDTYKEQIDKEGYTIDGLSIGVMLNTDYISEPIRTDLVKLIANVGGVVPEVAPEVISVVNLPTFGADIITDDVLQPKIFGGFSLNQLLLAAAILAIILIVLFLVLAISNGSAKKKRARFEQQVIAYTGFDEEEKVAVAAGFTVNADGEPLDFPSLTDDSVETKEVVIRREIGEFAKTSPDIVAQLLKSWMKDEDD